MTRRDDIKAETRLLIIRSARKLFRKNGMEQCTMRAVAKEAGVSPGTVMLHFKSKDALLEASISEDIQKVLDKALNTMPQRGSLLDRLMHIPSAMYRFYATNRELYRALVKSTIFEPEEANPLVTDQLNGYLGFITQTIMEEISAGRVSSDLEPHVTASSIASLYIGVLIHFFRAESMSPEDAIATLRAMKQQLLKGILIKEAR